MENPNSSTLIFKGVKYFRQRVICSLLSGKAIKIDDIRLADENPGLRGTIIQLHPKTH
jgi:RNA 3'-terminal phosphate cyclase